MGDPTAPERLGPFDRPWSGTRSARALGGVAPPDPAAIRRALLRLGAAHPRHPSLALLDADGGCYRPLPANDRREHLTSCVRSQPDLTFDAAEHLLATLLSPREQTLEIVVGADCLVLGAAHALGDGRSMSRLLSAVLTEAEPDLRFFRGRTRAVDVLRLCARTYGATPSSTTRALRTRQVARAAVQQSRDRPAAAPASQHPARDPTGAVRVAQRQIAGRELERLRRWRTENAPQCSVGALLISSWFRALARHRVASPEGFHLLVDTRRYGSARDAELWGNYAQSVWIAPSDVMAPEPVAQAMREVLASSWPLAALAITPLRARSKQSSAGPPGAAVPRAFYLSYVGARAGAQPQRAPGRMMSATTPADGSSVTVQLRAVGEGLSTTVSCSEDDPAVDDLVGALTDLSHPLDLL